MGKTESLNETNDYQSYMRADVGGIDAAGNEAAEGATVENFGVKQDWTHVPAGGGYKEHKEMQGQFGMMPGLHIPTDFAEQRRAFFEKELARTKQAGWGASWIAKGHENLMNAYIWDMANMPQAEAAYNMVVPMANMAARSYVKADSVGISLDFNPETNLASTLSGPKEEANLTKAVHNEQMDRQMSVTNAARKLSAARWNLMGASNDAAAEVSKAARHVLEGQLKAKEDRKSEIQASIAKVGKYVGYVEQFGSLVAGGAGAVHDNLLPGAGTPYQVTDEMRDPTAGKVKGAGEGIQTGGGYLTKAVTFGVELYHAEELQNLNIAIEGIKSQISTYASNEEEHRIDAIGKKLRGAAEAYAAEVQQYQDALEDRRKHMANIGTKADKSFENKNKGAAGGAGDAMLWLEVMLELQSNLNAGKAAAEQAGTVIDPTAAKVTEHRTSIRWGDVARVYEADTGRTEGLDAPDVSVLRSMRNLNAWWLSSALQIKSQVDSAVAINEGLVKGAYKGEF